MKGFRCNLFVTREGKAFNLWGFVNFSCWVFQEKKGQQVEWDHKMHF